MRLFKLLFGTKDTPDTGQRLEDLEKAFRRLQEEWTDVYAKFRTMQMRVAKQVQRLDEPSKEGPAQEGREDGEVGGASSLSPRMQAIQNGILARRSRGVPRKEGE